MKAVSCGRPPCRTNSSTLQTNVELRWRNCSHTACRATTLSVGFGEFERKVREIERKFDPEVRAADASAFPRHFEVICPDRTCVRHRCDKAVPATRASMVAVRPILRRA